MEQENIITGESIEEIRSKITEVFSNREELYDYNAIIKIADRKISLRIDIDLGGGFESGYEYTSLKAPLSTIPDYRFAIHQEHFTDEIGKFFGMQDVVIGFKEFDDKFIIKTNDKAKTRKLFANAELRAFFRSLSDFNLRIHIHNDNEEKEGFLEFEIDKGITDSEELNEAFTAFYTILTQLDN